MSKSGFFRSRAPGIALGIGLSLVCLVLLFRGINLEEVGAVIAQADRGLLAAAVAVALLNYIALAARWGILFYPHYSPHFMHLFGAQCVGQLVNATLPGRLSPLARTGWLSLYDTISATFTLSTIVMEKILDGVIYSLLLVIVLASMPLPGWVRDAGWATGIISVVVAGLVLGVAATKPQLIQIGRRVGDRAPGLAHLRIVSVTRSAVDSVDVWRYPRQVLQVLAWSGAVWGITLWLNLLALRALHLDVPLAAAVVVLIFVQAGLRLPSSPGSIGVFHYLAVLALSLFGVDRAAALGYAIVLHLLSFLPQSLLGVGFVWRARDRLGGLFPVRVLVAAESQSHRTTAP